MINKPIVTQSDYEVYVLRDKFGRYFGRLADPVIELRKAWRFYHYEDIATVVGMEHYAPAADLEYRPIKVKITMVTIEQTLEDEPHV